MRPVFRILLLALWVASVRAVSFDTGLTHSDEGFYLLQGGAWLHGVPPYTVLWDVKPPGLLALFALFRLFGTPGVLAARIGTALAVLATAEGLHRFARRHLAEPRVAWIAALLYPAYSVVLEGVAAQPELLLTPFVVFGMDLVAGWWTGGARRPSGCLGAGLLFGIAVLIKQSAALELALAAAVAALPLRRPRLLPPALFLAAAATPSVAFIGYEAACGLGPEIFLTPFAGAAARLAGYGNSFADALLRVPFMLRSAVPLLGGVLACIVERRRLAASPDARAVGLIALWLGAGLAAVIAARAAYWHYFLEPLAPMTLLSAVWMRTVVLRVRRSGAVLAVLVGGFVAYPLAALALVELPVMRHAAFAEATADRLKGLGLQPGDTLYVVDRDPMIYVLTAARPPTRYVFPQHLMCDFPLPEGDGDSEVRRIMASRPRFVVISAGRPRMLVCDWRADRVAVIDRALARDYTLAATVDTGEEPAEIWRLDAAE